MTTNNQGQCLDCWRSGDEREGCNCLTGTDVPHVHTTDEAVLWWREAFPQWRGRL